MSRIPFGTIGLGWPMPHDCWDASYLPLRGPARPCGSCGTPTPAGDLAESATPTVITVFGRWRVTTYRPVWVCVACGDPSTGAGAAVGGPGAPAGAAHAAA